MVIDYLERLESKQGKKKKKSEKQPVRVRMSEDNLLQDVNKNGCIKKGPIPSFLGPGQCPVGHTPVH